MLRRSCIEWLNGIDQKQVVHVEFRVNSNWGTFTLMVFRLRLSSIDEHFSFVARHSFMSTFFSLIRAFPGEAFFTESFQSISPTFERFKRPKHHWMFSKLSIWSEILKDSRWIFNSFRDDRKFKEAFNSLHINDEEGGQINGATALSFIHLRFMSNPLELIWNTFSLNRQKFIVSIVDDSQRWKAIMFKGSVAFLFAFFRFNLLKSFAWRMIWKKDENRWKLHAILRHRWRRCGWCFMWAAFIPAFLHSTWTLQWFNQMEMHDKQQNELSKAQWPSTQMPMGLKTLKSLIKPATEWCNAIYCSMDSMECVCVCMCVCMCVC